ncbi:MAG: hypothetical protein F6K65_34335 [Moorea sp. SIO3C2]|nr:hypothetical protein [Moorena sp. SIO3C2]
MVAVINRFTVDRYRQRGGNVGVVAAEGIDDNVNAPLARESHIEAQPHSITPVYFYLLAVN